MIYYWYPEVWIENGENYLVLVRLLRMIEWDIAMTNEIGKKKSYLDNETRIGRISKLYFLDNFYHLNHLHKKKNVCN